MNDWKTELFADRHQEHIAQLFAKPTRFECAVQELVEHQRLQDLKIPDLDHERKASEVTVTNLLECWKGLHTLLQSYEGILQSRWQKQPQSRKKEILMAAWPDMPETHRPHMAHFFGKCGDLDGLTESDLLPLQFPYINLEDLLKPKALLIFLNSRGRNHPSCFAYSDLELAPLWKIPNEFLTVHGYRYTMSFSQEVDPVSYGSWIEWQDETKALESVVAGRTVHARHGLQIIYLQCKIMQFLKRCVLYISDDIKALEFPLVLPEPEILTDQGMKIERTDIIAREAPYRLPCQLDLPRLQDLIQAQLSQAIDHVWALYEAPDYFATTVEEYREHCLELIPNKGGKMHPDASNYPLYNISAQHIAAESHSQVFVWNQLRQLIDRAQSLMTLHAADISKDKDLPTELHDNLSELRYSLEAVMLNSLGDIDTEFVASPAVRHCYHRVNTGDKSHRVELDKSFNTDNSLGRLLRLMTIMSDKGSRGYFTVHALMDEFERLMETDSQAKGFVTARMTKSFSRVSVLAECLHQLHLFQPWAHKIEHEIQERKIMFAIRHQESMQPWTLIYHYSGKFINKKLYKLCSPHDGKFKYPVQECPTHAKVDRMKAAEDALDAFWRSANVHWMKVNGTTPNALIKHIIGDRKLERTSPWVAPSIPRIPPKALQTAITEPGPFSKEAHDISKQVTGAFKKTVQPSKVKCKTRGVAAFPEDEEPALDLAPAQPRSVQTVLKVNKRSLKVFRVLFYSPDSPNQPGELAWSDLRYAITSVGFRAEKLRSSAWHFTPPASIGNRSIQFHGPHPSNKLPFVLARDCGRRLNIAYKWTIDSFELA
ncbi:hypothetical protein OPT61_g5750 [Boeremia exigua]|uniref:Uncharacterized protein n=1 Tax=Boeremia exigua TaxID=749465 RepID=A0ACC2I952_9PLEO|nr:hypothetical protein OPT61_g5750 [Boeremia exigua]